jgi:hypothetical protein
MHVLGAAKSVFGWAVVFAKAVMSCGLWKICCEKTVVRKVEDCLLEQL